MKSPRKQQRSRMGEAAGAMLRPRTGQDTLKLVSGKADEPKRPLTRTSGLRHISVLVLPEQYAWLRRQAFEHTAKQGGGRPDASVLVREALADYIAARQK